MSPAGSAYPTIDGKTAYSDDNGEFLEAAEGEKGRPDSILWYPPSRLILPLVDYVDEWDGGNTDIRGDEKEEGDEPFLSDCKIIVAT